MERKFVVESIVTNPNQFDDPMIVVLAEDVAAGPAHAKRITITGDLDLLHCGGRDRLCIGDTITLTV